jgi:cyclohexadienyl dehydratase
VRIAWPELTARLGEVDVVMSGVTMRADRALVGRYSRPYAKAGAVLLVRKSDAGRFRDLAAVDQPSVRVAVNRGGHLERVGHQLLSHAALDAVDDNRSLPSRVRDGRADAALTDSAEAREWVDADLKTLGPFTSDHKAFLLPADRGDLAARLDDWMVAREADGWLAAERARWLGKDNALDAASASRDSVAALIALRVSLMPSVAAAKRAAGLPIEDPAQETKVLDRVRSANEPSPQRALAVYRTLIEIAKDVQKNASADAPTATLDALRAAIGRVDDQLGRELRRLPKADVVTWSSALDRDLAAVGVGSPLRLRLAGALATGRVR